MVKRTKAEQETHISRAADESNWLVYSCDPVAIRKLERLYGQGAEKGEGGRVWSVPLRGVSFRRPKKAVALSPQKRSELAARLAKARERRK